MQFGSDTYDLGVAKKTFLFSLTFFLSIIKFFLEYLINHAKLCQEI